MARQTYELLVIGGGSAGSTVAGQAAENGLKVALVERDKLGGTCLNYGCDPTKTMLYTAHLLYTAQHAERFAIKIKDVAFDWQDMQARLRGLVERIRGGTHEDAVANLKSQGIDVLLGQAKFVSANEVEVNGETYKAEVIIIAAGSEASVPNIPGLQETGFVTNKEIIWLDELPGKLAIIGSGPIGVEFAQMFRRFGCEVVVLEHGDRLLDTEDAELSEMLCERLRKQDIRFETSVELKKVEQTADGKQITFQCPDKDEEKLVGCEILVATGRKPNTDKLNLEAAGVEYDEKGIKVDKTLRTNVPHIWAIGDIASKLQFTHVADAQAELVFENAFSDTPKPFDDSVIPWATYTNPSLAHIGQTEDQLKEAGIEYNVAKQDFEKLSKAISTGETAGMVKLLADKDGKILGCHILSHEAGEIIMPVVLAMKAGLTVQHLSETIYPYPNMVEAVKFAADQLVK